MVETQEATRFLVESLVQLTRPVELHVVGRHMAKSARRLILGLMLFLLDILYDALVFFKRWNIILSEAAFRWLLFIQYAPISVAFWKMENRLKNIQISTACLIDQREHTNTSTAFLKHSVLTLRVGWGADVEMT